MAGTLLAILGLFLGESWRGFARESGEIEVRVGSLAELEIARAFFLSEASAANAVACDSGTPRFTFDGAGEVVTYQLDSGRLLRRVLPSGSEALVASDMIWLDCQDDGTGTVEISLVPKKVRTITRLRVTLTQLAREEP